MPVSLLVLNTENLESCIKLLTDGCEVIIGMLSGVTEVGCRVVVDRNSRFQSTPATNTNIAKEKEEIA